MPELPEVEIVRQSLLKNIKGKKINKVLVRNRNLRFKLETSFEKKLKNKFISNIKRFSKYLIIEFKNLIFLDLSKVAGHTFISVMTSYTSSMVKSK